MAELPNTIDSGSVEKEQTMLDQRAWTRKTWQSRLIRVRLLKSMWSMHHIELKIWARIIWIANKIEPNLVNLNWAIRVLHELNMKQNPKQHMVT
jgi:hypothetical protein